jgi:hypothetical protein
MARNIGADGSTVYRAVIEKTYADGRTYTAHEGPYTELGPARARVTFWRNRMAAYGDGRSATGHVEQAHTVWAPVGEDVDRAQAAERAAIRAEAYRDAARLGDQLAAEMREADGRWPEEWSSREVRDAVQSVAGELRNHAAKIHPAEESSR